MICMCKKNSTCRRESQRVLNFAFEASDAGHSGAASLSQLKPARKDRRRGATTFSEQKILIRIMAEFASRRIGEFHDIFSRD
jgi:hypothetical protein